MTSDYIGPIVDNMTNCVSESDISILGGGEPNFYLSSPALITKRMLY